MFSLSCFKRIVPFLLPLLASCAFPGQYFGADPGDPDESRVSNGVDYKLIPIDGVTLSALSRRDQNERVLIPARLQAESSAYEYKVGVGDLIRITVWDHPELTNPAGNTTGQLQGQLVQADGTFYFPFLGKVKAEGRTTEDIRVEVTERLEKFIRSPQVDVFIQQGGFRSQKFYVSGEVTQPGFFPISDIPTRLTDALSLAGGLTKQSYIEEITLQRDGVTYSLDGYRLFYEGDLTQNILLRNGDVINIQDRRTQKVFLMGEVVRPTSFVMPVGKLTLAEVISDIGGINQNTSNAAQVYVIRQAANSDPLAPSLDIFHLDSTSPTSILYSDSFEMKPRDLVYVDPVGLVRINRLLGTILPSLQVLPTLRANIRVFEGD